VKSNFKANTKAIGDIAEEQAKVYLQQHGLTFIESNFHCRLGEIDLIMLDNTSLVFVEVRFRRSNAFGGAAVSVSKTKQQKIKSSALYYLQKNNLYEKQASRFDVIAISNTQCDWIQGAF